jgi:signal transduction histidine kinase
MRYSEELLGEYRGCGDLRAWLAAIAFFGAAYLWFGAWPPWVARAAQLVATYALSFVALSFMRLALPWPQHFAVPAVLSFVIVGASALWPAILLQAPGVAASAREPILSSFIVAATFAGAMIIPGIFMRRAEQDRRRADAERHTRELEQQTHLKQLAEMRLKALHAQIEPHFLFNTLGNVQHLLRTSPADADTMLESLIRYLKSAVPQMRSGVSTVGEELARVEAYLAIMRVRMGPRLRYHIEVSAEAREHLLPPLSLMTLVENSVKHGVDPKPAGGFIRVVGCMEGATLTLAVIDDGVGFTREIGGGIGLTNLRDRLSAIHGGTASLDLSPRDPGGVEAILTIHATTHAVVR